MGRGKFRKGDGHILFHVGKELPEEGDSIMLVPGKQKAQGRGVYFSDEPRLKYSGGEGFRKKLETTPIFCVPMLGGWNRSKKQKKHGGEVSYHSDGKVIALSNLKVIDSEIDGVAVKYYYPKELSFFKEPDLKKSVRHGNKHSEFSKSVLKGWVDFEEAVRKLRGECESDEFILEEELILEKIIEAMEKERMPKHKEVYDRLYELRVMREGTERRVA